MFVLTGPSEAGGQGGQLHPPTFAKNGSKLVNNGGILVEFWFLTPHFWVLTPHFSVASEGPDNCLKTLFPHKEQALCL